MCADPAPLPTLPAPWLALRRHTPARVALGRAGAGLPTSAHLRFQAAHAAARDAVHAELDLDLLAADLAVAGLGTVRVRSACPDRQTYLLRPDLGRRLLEEDATVLQPQPGCTAVLLCDGLSAAAVQRHGPPLVARLAVLLRQAGQDFPPVVLARQGRVALGDPVGAALGAAAVVVLLGERPGLSAPDSLGAYLTWQPRPGRTDAERNCVSNIRPDGFPPEAAADKLAWLLSRMRSLRLSGVGLKDDQAKPGLEGNA